MGGVKVLGLYIFCCCLNAASAEENYLYSVIVSIDQALRYYAENYMHMNVDGIYGLRVIEGQLVVIIDHLSATASSRNTPVRDLGSKPKPFYTDGSLLALLKSFHNRAANISEIAQESLRLSDQKYYDLVKPLVYRAWKFAKPFGISAVSPDLKWSAVAAGDTGDLVEEVSDRCMSEIMGIGASPVPCSISSNCLTLMTVPYRTGYYLTHQLLYTMLAEVYGCLPVINLRLRPAGTSVDQLRIQYCTNNLYELNEMLVHNHGFIPTGLQDLFMEQEFVCPMLGYSEFLHIDWLVRILSWQKTSGCWGEDTKVEKNDTQAPGTDKSMSKVESDVEHKTNMVVNEVASDPSVGFVNKGLDPPRFNTRRLLYERFLDDGCLSHKTAVAMGALSQYLRFMLMTESPLNVSLYGINYIKEPHKLLYKKLSTDDSSSTSVNRQLIEKNEQVQRMSQQIANSDTEDSFGQISHTILTTTKLPPSGKVRSKVEEDYDDAAEVELDEDNLVHGNTHVDQEKVLKQNLDYNKPQSLSDGLKYVKESNDSPDKFVTVSSSMTVLLESRQYFPYLFSFAVLCLILLRCRRCRRCFMYRFHKLS